MGTSGISTIRLNGSSGRAKSSVSPHISRCVTLIGSPQLHQHVHLQTFSDNEVQKGELTVQLKRLRQKQEALSWPSEKPDLPVITWEDCKYSVASNPSVSLLIICVSDQRQAESRALICIAGYIHDVGDFFDKHPGGPYLLKKNIGKDATPAFFGGLYDHGNAAHNVCPVKFVLRCFP